MSRAGHVFWLFGLSGAGKTTLSSALAAELRGAGRTVLSLDGDELRADLCRDLDFSPAARTENIRRAACVAKLAAAQGHVVIAAFITPTEELRDLAVSIVGPDRIDLIWLDVPLAVCRERDAKGLYRRAEAGNLPLFTGVGAIFQAPREGVLRISLDSRAAMSAALSELVHRRLSFPADQ